MSNSGDWPRGALPLGPSLYEDAMTPIYEETVWRERNFYKSDGGSGDASDDPGLVSGFLDAVSRPIYDFGAFLRPAGRFDWARVGMVVGGLLVIGYLLGREGE